MCIQPWSIFKFHDVLLLFFQSEKAGQISQHQLLVAMRLGNPILAAQCKVFAAMSLIQRGQLKMASKIIRCVTWPWTIGISFISKSSCINKLVSG